MPDLDDEVSSRARHSRKDDIRLRDRQQKQQQRPCQGSGSREVNQGQQVGRRTEDGPAALITEIELEQQAEQCKMDEVEVAAFRRGHQPRSDAQQRKKANAEAKKASRSRLSEGPEAARKAEEAAAALLSEIEEEQRACQSKKLRATAKAMAKKAGKKAVCKPDDQTEPACQSCSAASEHLPEDDAPGKC